MAGAGFLIFCSTGVESNSDTKKRNSLLMMLLYILTCDIMLFPVCIASWYSGARNQRHSRFVAATALTVLMTSMCGMNASHHTVSSSLVLGCTSTPSPSGDLTRFHLRYGNAVKHDTDTTEHCLSHVTPDSFNSKAVHGAYVPESLGSVVFPIYQTSTFRFESAEHGAKCFSGESDGFIYTR